jgi:anthranilate synthase component 1
MSNLQISSYSDFAEQAKSFNVVPVHAKVLADTLTPVAVYELLAANRAGTFLLESAEHGRIFSRYSFVGVNSPSTMTVKDGQVSWIGEIPAGAPLTGSPLDALALASAHLRSPNLPGLPPLTGGLVGFLSYEIVRRLERLPDLAVDDLALPELAFMLTHDLAIFDHYEGTLTLIANAINWDGSDERVPEAYEDAKTRVISMVNALRGPLPISLHQGGELVAGDIKRSMTGPEYEEKVELIKEDIRAGEAFQVVLSQRFSTECTAAPLEVYRALRLRNPSPYMYLLRLPDGLDIVGSSPEALVKITGVDVMVHPIAGTRPRSSDPDEDRRRGEELLADPKERAEHLMLVDLGRNDLGRVCQPGSVEVIEFMQVERYSHVMHIVSTVIGKLAPDSSPVAALYAVFPAGTLSGAPKPRAMEIIEKHEPLRRGIYGGVIGYLDFQGNVDACIAIRTAVIKDGIAHVQAGAGIVADSVPANEEAECRNKAAAVLQAIAAANSMVEI